MYQWSGHKPEPLGLKEPKRSSMKVLRECTSFVKFVTLKI